MGKVWGGKGFFSFKQGGGGGVELIPDDTMDTYKNAGGLSANDIIDGNIRHLKIKIGIDKVPIENHQLPKMYWMPQRHKNPIKARFIVASPKSSVKPLARTITSVFHLFFRQI